MAPEKNLEYMTRDELFAEAIKTLRKTNQKLEELNASLDDLVSKW